MSDEPADEARPEYRDVTHAIKRASLPDPFTTSLYAYSPYQACAHGCAYCDGRAEKYFVEGEFDRDIRIRRNLPALFEAEIGRLREPGIICAGSGVTDVYQPLEAREGLMAQVAAILAGRPFPAMVLTKSNLVRRDLPLWKRIAEGPGFILCVTITGTDEEVRRVFERRAASYQERLETVRLFHDAGCPVGVLAMPLLPGLSDDRDSMERLFSACKESGADFIMPGNLTLRPGRQKEFFLSALASRFPELAGQYEDLYAENRSSGNTTWRYREAFYRRAAGALAKLQIPSLCPHRIYRTMMPAHDEIFILLNHMASLFESRGVNTAGLKKSLSSYGAWLAAERSKFRRHRSWPSSYLSERFSEAHESGELSSLIDNRKLTAFIRAVAIDRAVFDYVTLKLS